VREDEGRRALLRGPVEFPFPKGYLVDVQRKRLNRRLVMLALLAACGSRRDSAVAAPVVGAAGVAPPAPAEPGTFADTLHGVVVTDPYRWLEDTTDARVIAWAAAQRRYTDSILARLVGRDSLATLVVAVYRSAPTLDAVLETPGRILLTRYLGDAPSLFAVDSGSTTERLILSADALASRMRGARMRALVPSFDGAQIAIGTTERGDANAAVSVIDAVTGRARPDRIPDLLTTTSGTRYEVSWLPDGSGFFYPRLWPGAANGSPAERLSRGRQFLHRLGTSQSQDIPAFGFGVSPQVTLDPVDLPTRVLTAPGSRWAVGSVYRSKASGTDYFLGELASIVGGTPSWSPLATVDDRVSALQLRGDTVYALSRRAADRGTIVRRLLGAPASAWTTVVAEQAGVILTFTMQVDGLYFTERSAGAIRLLRRTPAGVIEPVAVPLGGSIRLSRGRPGVAGVLIATESWVTAPHWQRVGHNGTRLDTMPFDDGSAAGALAGLTSARIEATSPDGTRVPVSVVYGTAAMNGGTLDGTAPLLIETYGAFSVSTDPSYNPFLRAWVALGGVYAYAHVRGGGELGDAWHTAAMRENKHRSIDDVIGAIETLIARRFTSAGRVVIMGVSFGANVPGMAMIQRPDLFGAVLYEVGQPDEIRGSALDPTAARNIAEIGDLDTPGGIRALLMNSPYHSVPASVSLPAVIVHSAAEDYNFGTQMLAAKYVARLQKANSGVRPVLWMPTDGGHQALFGLGPARAAQALSFVLWQTGVARYQPR
jgi:prolyl oligopeptidase